MPHPLISASNLARGIQNFLAHPRWRRDFHNLFYSRVTAAVLNARSLNGRAVGAYRTSQGTLWDDIANELTFWRALRPFPKQHFLSANTAPLNTAYRSIASGLPYIPLQLSCRPQTVLLDLFATASVLKPDSIVFPSKCCHMLLPWEFPVWDRTFVGKKCKLNDLQESLEHDCSIDENAPTAGVAAVTSSVYWRYRCILLSAWDNAPNALKGQLIALLQAQINGVGGMNVAKGVVGVRPWQYFPFRTKIPELCLSGF